MSKLKVVSYAINGRGMGHLVRQLAILRWVQRITALCDIRCECWILTSSEADTLARREGIPAFKMPSKAMLRDAGIEPARYLSLMRTWVLNTVAGLKPDLLLVDTFAGGSFGELVAALELAPKRVIVSRRVREAYQEEDPFRALLPLYQLQIQPDERGTGPILIRERAELLERDAAREQLGVPAGARAVYVTLGGGGDVAAGRTLPTLCDALTRRGWHVVVGAGPLYAGKERRGPNITWMSRYCPLELFRGFDAAVSAGGYNTFHELMFAGVPTVFLPQPRIADDQDERAQRAATAGAGRIARSIDEVPELLDDPGDAAAARGLVPDNGARAAALSALSLVMSAADLATAERVLTDDVVGALLRFGDESSSRLMELVRLACGDMPSERARVRATLLELADRGYAVPGLRDEDVSAERVVRLVDVLHRHQVPFETGLLMLRGLHRKFPHENRDALLAAAERLFRCWARFGDWMGAVSLMRAVPSQRAYGLEAFADDLVAWLATEEDLFDALRSLTRLEEGGSPLRENLVELAKRGGERGAAQ